MIRFIKTEHALKLEKELGLNFTPRRASPGSSGYDLSACLPFPLPIYPDEVVKIPTGVKVWIGEMDEDVGEDIALAGLYLPRSSSPGLKLENTVGLLDSDYQGESFLKYRNITEDIIRIKPGEKIGQLVFIPTYIGKLLEVTSFSEETSRGQGGFGSTDR
jgi:dUTP pyrophosphatase